MIKITNQQILALTSLLVVLGIGVSSYLWKADNQQARFFLLLFLCLGYVVWGVSTHLLTDKAKHPKVVVEYILVGLLGLALVSFILYDY